MENVGAAQGRTLVYPVQYKRWRFKFEWHEKREGQGALYGDKNRTTPVPNCRLTRLTALDSPTESLRKKGQYADTKPEVMWSRESAIETGYNNLRETRRWSAMAVASTAIVFPSLIRNAITIQAFFGQLWQSRLCLKKHSHLNGIKLKSVLFGDEMWKSVI